GWGRAIFSPRPTPAASFVLTRRRGASRLTQRRGERGGSESAEGCFWFSGAAETSLAYSGIVCCGGLLRAGQGSRGAAGLARQVPRRDEPRSHRQKPHSSMKMDPGEEGSDPRRTQPGPATDSALSAAPREMKTPRLRVSPASEAPSA